MKLNIGCGLDYREGYINVDGNPLLPRVDRIIHLSAGSLLEHFELETFDEIHANDIIEHHFRWEAVGILRACLKLLKQGGLFRIRVPDTAAIIERQDIAMSRKIELLYGGQDVHQPGSHIMNQSRKVYPHFFLP